MDGWIDATRKKKERKKEIKKTFQPLGTSRDQKIRDQRSPVKHKKLLTIMESTISSQ